MVFLVGALFVGGPATPTAAVDAPGLKGVVTFDSAGVNGATVELLSGGVVVGSTSTNGAGSYEIAAPASGTFDVRVTPPIALGVMAQTVVGVVVPTAPTVATVDVALRRPLGSVRVRLVDDSVTALSGLRVRLVTRSGGVSVVDLGVTDATGRVELRAPVGVDYGLRIDAITGSSTSLPTDFALRVDQAVQASNGGSDVVITVPIAVLDVTTTRSGGAPVGNVVVAARAGMAGLDLGGGLTGSGSFTASGTTTSSGEVSLPTVRQMVTVETFPRDPLLIRSTTSVTVAAPPTTVTITLADAPTAPLSITLLDGGGIGVPGATVSATTSATTGATGAASVLVRADRLTGVSVRTSGDGGLDLPDRLSYYGVVPPVGTETLQPPLADLAVTVLDVTSGDPIPGATVTVSSPLIPAGDWSVRSSADPGTSDVGGIAIFRLVPGGQYGVTVRVGARIGSETVTLAAGGTGVAVRLPPAAVSSTGTFPSTVTGRIVTPGGAGIAGLSVQSTVGGTIGTTDTDGNFSVRIGALTSHGLRIRGTHLLDSNGSGAEIPDQLDVRTGSVLTLSPTLADVALGDIVLPIDRLDLQVTDETGGGLFALVARSPLTGTRTTTSIAGAPVALYASSGYVDDGIRLDEFGEGTMYLFTGTHQVTVDEESLVNFSDIDLPVTEPATLTAGPDLLRLVLTRRYGTPVTTLTGSPLVSSAPLTLQLPDAVLVPIVELPDSLANSTISTNIILIDHFWCDAEIVTDPADCEADGGGEVNVSLNDVLGIPPQLGPGTYQIAVRSFAIATGVPGAPGGGSVFVQEGFRRSTLELVAPSDAPPVLSGVDTPAPTPEGSLALLSATASDAEGAVVVAWDLDGDGIGDIEGDSVWVDVPDGPSVTSVGTIVTDSAGRSVRGAVELESLNVAPTGTLTVGAPDASRNVEVAVTDLDDPSSVDRATLVVELDLDGDGLYETPGAKATIDASALADGSFPVGARITDKDDGFVLLSGSFTVGATPTTTSTVSTTSTTSPPATPTTTPVGPVAPDAAPSATSPPAVTTPTLTPGPFGTQLPETGDSPFGLLTVALGLLVLGAAFAATSRRSRASEGPRSGVEH